MNGSVLGDGFWDTRGARIHTYIACAEAKLQFSDTVAQMGKLVVIGFSFHEPTYT